MADRPLIIADAVAQTVVPKPSAWSGTRRLSGVVIKERAAVVSVGTGMPGVCIKGMGMVPGC
ncbi:hypothetical protein [Mycobacterium sp. URHB0021]